MVNVVTISSELGYLQVPDGMLIDPDDIGKYAANRVVVLSTGSQGEPMSALTRMARSTHRKVDIMPGDTVIIAATPIPGNERYVGRTFDELFRLGANVIYGTGSGFNAHVSGHGNQEDLKLMLNLMRPKYFIPVHGEYRMLRQHAMLAESVGIDPDNIFIVDNGDTVEIQNGEARRGAKVPAGKVLIDGLGVGDVGNIVLQRPEIAFPRRHPRHCGDAQQAGRQGSVRTRHHFPGFVYVRESEGLLEEANRIVSNTLSKLMSDNVNEWASLKTHVKEALGRFLI